jgi:transposase
LAGKKMEAVLRLLRGESLEELSRELQVEAHRLVAWRDDFWRAARKASRANGPTDPLRIASSGMLSARSGS